MVLCLYWEKSCPVRDRSSTKIFCSDSALPGLVRAGTPGARPNAWVQ